MLGHHMRKTHLLAFCMCLFLCLPTLAATNIVVLGGILNADLSLNEWTKARVDTAYDLYQEDPTRTIILSGKGPRAHTEAQTMRDYLLEKGVPSENIVLEEKSMSTIQNALYTFELLDKTTVPTDIILVTNHFHMNRSLAWFNFVFADSGINIAFYAAPDHGFTAAELQKTREKEARSLKCHEDTVFKHLTPGDIKEIKNYDFKKNLPLRDLFIKCCHENT